MKVQLSKDPLFQVKDSPVKQLKQKELERQRQMRILRMNPIQQKKEINIEIVDPLPKQLKQYKNQTSFKKTFQHSKARDNLKKYIIQQQKNLKCLRLQRISDTVSNTQLSPRSKGNMKMQFLKPKDQQKSNKQINIPKIQDLFKNQQKQIILYENKVLKNKLSKAMTSIDHNVSKIKSLTFAGKTTGVHESKKTTQGQKFPAIHQPQVINQQDLELDTMIQKKLKRSEELREKLYKEKKEMSNHTSKQTTESKNLNFFLSVPKKAKKKVLLEGVKSITFNDGSRKLNITPASSLLFELNRLSTGRQKKQHELSGLLKNSFQNRDSILMQKSTFYDQETPFNDLTPSNQFRLRQLMDQKLLRRLELSKEQVNNFNDYLIEIKEYHVILNECIIQILKEIRQALLSGKVMKNSDLTAILKNKSEEELTGYPNELIISKLYDMMI